MEDSTTPLQSSILTSIHSWFTPTILFFFLNFMIATILFTSNLPNTNTNTNTNNNKQNQQKTQNQNDSSTSTTKLARSPSIFNRLGSFNLQPYISQSDQTTPKQQDDTLEQAAAQYVFDHPFPLDHQHQDPQPIPVSPKPDLDPTHEVQPISKAQTHFIHDKHTIEKVTTHFDFGPTHVEKDDFMPTQIEKMPEKEPENFPEEENDQFQSLDEVYSIITNNDQVNRTKSDTIPSSGEVPVKLPAKMKKSASVKSPFAHFEEDKIVESRRPATVRERRREVVDGGDDDVEVDAKADDFISKFKHQLKLQRLDSIVRYKDMVNRAGEKGSV